MSNQKELDEFRFVYIFYAHFGVFAQMRVHCQTLIVVVVACHVVTFEPATEVEPA